MAFEFESRESLRDSYPSYVCTSVRLLSESGWMRLRAYRDSRAAGIKSSKSLDDLRIDVESTERKRIIGD